MRRTIWSLNTRSKNLLIHAVNAVARARNRSALAREAGITRRGLYKALSPEANPSFTTLHAVAKALGVRITLTAA